MLQPAFPDCLFPDLLSRLQDSRAAALIDICGSQVGQALVIAVIVILIDDGADLPYEGAEQKVVCWQHPVLHCLAPSFNFAAVDCEANNERDLAPGLGLVWRTANVVHTFSLGIVGEIGRHVRRTVVAERPWLSHGLGLIAARGCQRHVRLSGAFPDLHRHAKLPTRDVPTVIIEDCRQIEPSPVNSFEISEVRTIGKCINPALEPTGIPIVVGAAGNSVAR